ncbi:MAG TPA: SDR family NAD(P)-dependent oxidoreductase [Solirubrobacteraceae bacterium]|nr:SDR family NAD(P)-dependent oxidoreductase [Solirubrobacteraceae bacterium]
MGSLEGKVVIVTGASSGIGEATAIACAREGAAVALGARRLERLEALAERLRAAGGRALAIQADVADEGQAQALVQRTRAELGRIDVLVNNAGLMLLGAIEGADTEQWRRMIAVNVFGVLYCTHAVLPQMRAQGSGHIVTVSSVAGRVARAGAGVYNLTKFGVGAFCESLRQELAPAGIRVSLIEPGVVATELAGHNSPEVLEQMARRFAGVTALQSEDIAEAIVFAISRPANVAVNEILIRPASQQG